MGLSARVFREDQLGRWSGSVCWLASGLVVSWLGEVRYWMRHVHPNLLLDFGSQGHGRPHGLHGGRDALSPCGVGKRKLGVWPLHGLWARLCTLGWLGVIQFGRLIFCRRMYVCTLCIYLSGRPICGSPPGGYMVLGGLAM
jgi:hypothetical protein